MDNGVVFGPWACRQSDRIATPDVDQLDSSCVKCKTNVKCSLNFPGFFTVHAYRPLGPLVSTVNVCKSRMDLKGKTVLVTGGSTGIGKPTALALAKRGADVTIIARNKDACELAVNEIKAAAGHENVGVLFWVNISVFQMIY